MKPFARSLTGFNGSTKTMLETIRLRVYTEGIAKNVKFSVIDFRAPYNAILGMPWIYAMKAIPSTYHQCIKFPGNDGQIITLRGDQAAARDLLVAEGGSSHDHIQALKLHLMLFLGSRRSLGPEGVETRMQVLSLALIQDDRLWLRFGTVGLASFEIFAKIQDLRGELNSKISRLDTIRLIV
uniref:Uncharacterized protein n=1 Tax=Brassica oleracea var. oleracea TaxID=109376 RepID=A0A0D3AV42_BRAOL